MAAVYLWPLPFRGALRGVPVPFYFGSVKHFG